MKKTTYALLSIGVNRTPNAITLKHAERDALRFGLAVTSAKGAIPPTNAKYMLGSTTVAELDRTLERLARIRPTFLMIYFGGHGSATGIALADGIYSYVRLRKRLAVVGTHATIIVLNCCEAAGMFKSGTALGGLEPVQAEWAARLLAAEPGVRVFAAAGITESTYESNALGGWFVSALIKAMFDARSGDLVDDDGIELVSDFLVFTRAKEIMEALGVTPEADGIFGDFPMMLSNDTKAGHVAIKIRKTANVGIIVDVTAHDRRHLATTIVATPTDAFRNVLVPEHTMFLPLGDSHPHQARFSVDVGVSPGCQQQLWQYGACRVIWDVIALDAERRVVGRQREIMDYETGRLHCRW